MKSAILTVADALLLAALGGCTQETVERHYREDTIQRESALAPEGAPREGARRPGNSTVEEHRSDPKIVVE